MEYHATNDEGDIEHEIDPKSYWNLNPKLVMPVCSWFCNSYDSGDNNTKPAHSRTKVASLEQPGVVFRLERSRLMALAKLQIRQVGYQGSQFCSPQEAARLVLNLPGQWL